MEEERRKDKELYSYKTALSQPYWIQKFNDNLSLKNPIKFSRIVYVILFFAIFWFLFELLFPFLEFGLRGMIAGLLSLQLGAFFSDIKIDGKSFIIYLKDFLVFYFLYGSKANRIYINKGQVYQKPTFFVKQKKGDK